MAAVKPAEIKKLRAKTGAGVMDCKEALTAAAGNFERAEEILKEKSLVKAEKKSDRETNEGYIASYVHNDFKTAALVEILCETDFVARNQALQELANNIAMQVVAMKPADVDELLNQDYLREPSSAVGEKIKQTSGTLGENLVLSRFVRYEVGDKSD